MPSCRPEFSARRALPFNETHAARAWMDANIPAGDPELAEPAWDALLAGAALQDPDVAVLFVREKEGDLTAERAAEAADGIFRGIGHSLAKGSFGSAAAWMDEARLAPAEASALATGVTGHASASQPELWAGWIADTLPPAEVASTLAALARRVSDSQLFRTGRAREDTIRQILDHWPAEDPTGRLDSLREHDIEP